MRLVATALRKQHWGGCLAGQAKGTPGPAGVLGAGELHYPWECVAARIMTKNMQFGIGLSSQINTVIHSLEERENTQVLERVSFGQHGCKC